MKPFVLACFCTLVLSPAACFAQKVGSLPLPQNDPAYRDVDTLQKAGIIIGYPDGGYSGGRIIMTPDTAAVAISLLLSQLHSGDLAVSTDLVARLQKSPPALNALLALVNEFAPEMQAKGVDVSAAKAPLLALQMQTLGKTRSRNFLLPMDDAAYQFADVIHKANIVLGYPDGTYGGRRPITRFEFAVAIARLLSWLQTDTSYQRTDYASRLQKSPAALNALRDLVNDFTPELEKLGQDTAAYQARLAALTPQFPDVPKSHWAYQAVLSLRQNGIVQGYPSGTWATSVNQEKPL